MEASEPAANEADVAPESAPAAAQGQHEKFGNVASRCIVSALLADLGKCVSTWAKQPPQHVHFT